MKQLKQWWYRLVDKYYEIKNRKKNQRKAIWNYLWDMQSIEWTYTCRSLNWNPNTYSWKTEWWIDNYKNLEEVLKMTDKEYREWLMQVWWNSIYPNCYNPVNKAIEVFLQYHK